MKSIWSEEIKIPERKPLQENIKVQTVVIGAGMAGILTAYFLKKAGADVVVIEADRIAGGQTKNTTAKITSQHGLFYDRLIRLIGRDQAEGYAMANEDAIKIYERIIKEEEISCDFKKLPAYLYSAKESQKEALEREAWAARSLGIEAYFVEKDEIKELPFETAGAVCFEGQAQFHPLKFIAHLAKDIIVYENTRALSVKKHTVYTDKGNITADNIVFATHYPFINVPGFYFLRQHQERSYVLMLEGQKELNGMYYSIDKKGLSLRSVGNILLLGGGAHRTGKNFEAAACEDEETGYSYIRKMAQKYYPHREEKACWSAQDCMPHDEIPFIGKYSMLRPYWHVATGFHKWGMTSSMVAALMISDRICGRYVLFRDVFKPQRCFFSAAIKNLLVDTGESVKGLCKGLFSKKECRCPHMGCRLEWNPEEESWDCPCHGSRFTSEGKLIDNPAQISKKQCYKTEE